MGDVGFSKEFGCVANETEHPAIQSIHEHLAVIGIVGHIPWLLYIVARIPGAAAAYSGFNWCGDEMDAKIKVSCQFFLAKRAGWSDVCLATLISGGTQTNNRRTSSRGW